MTSPRPLPLRLLSAASTCSLALSLLVLASCDVSPPVGPAKPESGEPAAPETPAGPKTTTPEATPSAPANPSVPDAPKTTGLDPIPETPAAPAPGLVLYVAPGGADTAPGTKEQPFATLAAARAAIRQLKSAGGGLPAGGVSVHLRGGLYLMDQSFLLGPEDSGAPEKPVVYRSEEGETVRLFGGRKLSGSDFKPVTDPALLARLAPEAQGKVMQADLSSIGSSLPAKFPDLFTGGGGIFALYQEDTQMPLSRWPNGGAYTTVSEVLDSGLKPAPHGGSFVYRGDRPERWQNALTDGQGLWIAGFWRVPWVIQSVRVASIDPAKKSITLAATVPGGIGSKYTAEVNGTRKGDGKEPYYALNLIEEIDQPGEWAYRFKEKTLYFWPSAPLVSAETLVATLAQPIVQLTEASHIRFEKIQFEGGLVPAVSIAGGESDLVVGCNFRNTGGDGLNIKGGQNHGVQSCDFSNIGGFGIQIEGGDRKTLKSSGHFADNNHIHHIGRVEKIVSGISVDGVGVRVTRNLIHDSPYGGVLYGGNDQLLELNEVHNIGLDGGDLGGFYTHQDWTSRGNIVRYNFVHHAATANGVYLDDGDCGDEVFGNIFYRIASGLFIGGGHDNIATGNIVIECGKGLHLDDRGISRNYNQTNKGMMTLLNAVDYKSPPWSERYPKLLHILDTPEKPIGNVLTGNLLVDCPKAMDITLKPEDLALNTIKDNSEMKGADIPAIIASDTLAFQPPAQPAGFPAIPFDQIGLRRDAWRATLPTAEETGRSTPRPPREVFDSNTDMKRSNELEKKP